jgi:chondroitin AC lyase
MYSKLLILFLLIGVSTRAQQVNQTGTAIDLIVKRTKALLLSDTAYATEQSYRLTDDVKYTTDGDGYYRSLSADGSWPDIDYHTGDRSAWKPSWHLYRLMLVIRAYHKNHDQAYLKAAHHALDYWIAHDFICSNWWQNQINIPFAYSTIMVMLDKDACTAELTFLDKVIANRVKQKAPTGQNKIWQHDIEARIALVHHNAEAFATAIGNMQSVIVVSAGEGLQPDHSFQQHGPMLQFGNYGLHFINSLLFWITVTANTPLAFDAQKQQMIFDYCTDGIRWTVFKGAMDITAIGRQLRNNADTKRGKTLEDDFGLLKKFDVSDPCKYALDGLTDQPGCTLNGLKSFYRSGYLVNLQGGKYMMSVKTHGGGISKVESINSENLKGSFLNDGVTLVQTTGREYHNIEPLWNWAMLPGTTGDTTIKTNDPEVFKTFNTGSLVGLLSNGDNAISAMGYNRLGTVAFKGYFMVNGMLVALGAGIESTGLKNVVTTVNQCFTTGKPVTSAANSKHAAWLCNDSIGYLFLDKDNKPSVSATRRLGNWSTVDAVSDKQTLTGNILSIYLSHSHADHYSYIVKPNTSPKQMEDIARHLKVKVIQNTKLVQAIEYDGVIMAAFYAPTLLQAPGVKLMPDKPCLVIYNTNGAKPGLWVSDPTKTAAQITLQVNGVNKTVAMPQGIYRGATATSVN